MNANDPAFPRYFTDNFGSLWVINSNTDGTFQSPGCEARATTLTLDDLAATEVEITAERAKEILKGRV